MKEPNPKQAMSKSKITEDQIANGMNAAYLKAGHNAYFGNGFRAGVEFILNNTESNSELLSQRDKAVEALGMSYKKLKSISKSNTFFDTVDFYEYMSWFRDEVKALKEIKE